MSPRKTAARSGGLPTRQQILDFIAAQPEKVGKREIARAFKLSPADRIALKRMLREMSEEGLVERRGKRVRQAGTLAPVELMEITGRDRDGELVASPADWDADAHGAPPRVLILAERGRGRGQPAPGVGDRALVRIGPAEGHEGIREGRIIKLLERRPRTMIGVFEPLAGGGGVVHSVDKKDRRDFRVEPGDEGGAREGDLVAIEVTSHRRAGTARAIVRERIGDMRSEHAVSLIAVLTHAIPHEFPADALTEAEAAPPADMAHREDLRRLPLVTIDPADAKDHDDAVHAAPDADPANPGGFIVTVAIADVAWYVRPGSALDRAARERGNSVYFPDRVVPMLPERLSGDLCSLMEGEDRPAMVAEIVIGADGRKRRQRFFRAMIRIAANIDYVEAQAAFDGQPREKSAALAGPVLAPLWEAYSAVARARDAREPLDLDLPERKLILSDTNHVERVIVPERLESHRLIEAFMILANVAAAETLEARHSPLIYRVHDSPSPEKLAALGDFLASIGLKMPKAGVLLPSHFNRILGQARDTEHAQLVNEVVLRSQAQAEYSADNFGHFGLNLRRYAHFTSPIRRYADLVVHRALIRALELGPGGLDDLTREALDDTAAHISATERRAMAAERETVDRLIAQFLADRVGASFSGRISGVTRAGLFVKLAETGADGFVPAATIGGDYYRYDEAGQRLVGDRTGESWRLGDAVDVRLVEAAPVAGALRFELLSEGHYLSGKPAKGGRQGRDRTAGKPSKRPQQSRRRQ